MATPTLYQQLLYLTLENTLHPGRSITWGEFFKVYDFLTSSPLSKNRLLLRRILLTPLSTLSDPLAVGDFVSHVS